MAIYEATSKFPTDERYGITMQLRKAAVSVPSNIAEGQGRNSKREFLHFLSIAVGSLKEVETQMLISHGLGYLTTSQINALLQIANDAGCLMGGLARSLRRLTTSH